MNDLEPNSTALRSTVHPRPKWWERPYWAFKCWWHSDVSEAALEAQIEYRNTGKGFRITRDRRE